jgi:hypothetical protein
MVEIQIYAFDASSGAFAQKTPLSIGQSKQDDYTLLLVISFTISDLEEREPPPS